MSHLMQPPKPKNVNEIWKNLHSIFQSQIRSLILSNNTSQFNKITKHLGFNTTQKKFLFEAIQIAESEPIPNYTPPKNPYQKSKPKNKSIIGKKRRRYNTRRTRSTSSSDSDYNSNNKPLKKRRKTTRKKKYSKKNNTPEMEKNGYFIVENIMDHCIENNSDSDSNMYKYKVKWFGYDNVTWEPIGNLELKSVKKYWKEKGFKMDKFGNIKEIKIRKKKNSKMGDKIYKCIPCDRVFENGYAYGGHCASKHRRKDENSKNKMIMKKGDNIAKNGGHMISLCSDDSGNISDNESNGSDKENKEIDNDDDEETEDEIENNNDNKNEEDIVANNGNNNGPQPEILDDGDGDNKDEKKDDLEETQDENENDNDK